MTEFFTLPASNDAVPYSPKWLNEFAISLIGDEARETMTRRVYSERYGKPLDKFHPGRVLAGILHRLVR
jgi:hypothetical protein